MIPQLITAAIAVTHTASNHGKKFAKDRGKSSFSYSKLNSGTISFVFPKGHVYRSRSRIPTPYLFIGRFSHLNLINLLILLRFPWTTRWFGKYQETPS